MMKIEKVVVFGVEADRAMVAALDDVPWNAGKVQAGAAGHGNQLGLELIMPAV